MQKIKRHIYLGKYDRQTLTNMRAHRGVTLPIRENNRQIETGWIINVEGKVKILMLRVYLCFHMLKAVVTLPSFLHFLLQIKRIICKE